MATPEPQSTDNLSDPDSRLMRKNRYSEFEQAYNAQASVDADGSQLVLSTHVTQCVNDSNELLPAIEGIPKSLGTPETVLADTGYLYEKHIRILEGDDATPKMNILVAVRPELKRQHHKHDFRVTRGDSKPLPVIRSPFTLAMKEKMQRPESREKYRLRKQTVEPVFGTIKKWMGFTQFQLRGHDKVSGEWQLVTLAYNMKRLWKMQNDSKQAVSPG